MISNFRRQVVHVRAQGVGVLMILSKMTVQIYDDVGIVEQITLCKLSDANTLLLNRNRGRWRQMQVWSMDTD